MKNLLFPPAFHILGWILFIPALIAGLLIYADALRNCLKFILSCH